MLMRQNAGRINKRLGVVKEGGPFLLYDFGGWLIFTKRSEKFQFSRRRAKPVSAKAAFGNSRMQKVDPSKAPDYPVFRAVAEVLGAKEHMLTVLDVGGYVGNFSIPVALCARQEGLKLKLHVVEPGATFDLLKVNVDANGLSDDIIVHNRAVTDFDGYTIYSYLPGRSIGGQVFRHDMPGSVEHIVPCSTIDSLVHELSVKGHLFIKLDTQGHEPNIIGGAKEILARKQAIWKIEFLHWAAQNRACGPAFSNYVLSQFEVFELPYVRLGPNRLDEQKMAGLIAMLSESEKYTDLLLIPKEAPFTEELIRRVESLRGR